MKFKKKKNINYLIQILYLTKRFMMNKNFLNLICNKVINIK